MKEEEIKKVVRERYASVARESGSCCTPAPSCCESAGIAGNLSKKVGYSDEDLKSAPEGANLGLGCGNPVAIALLREGEIVLHWASLKTTILP